MFVIERAESGNIIVKGRLDAAQSDNAEKFLESIAGEFLMDLSELEYISSAGLGVLLKTHKRLLGIGSGLKLIKVTNHIGDIFKYSGFDKLFHIEAQ